MEKLLVSLTIEFGKYQPFRIVRFFYSEFRVSKTAIMADFELLKAQILREINFGFWKTLYTLIFLRWAQCWLDQERRKVWKYLAPTCLGMRKHSKPQNMPNSRRRIRHSHLGDSQDVKLDVEPDEDMYYVCATIVDTLLTWVPSCTCLWLTSAPSGELLFERHDRLHRGTNLVYYCQVSS